MNGATGRPRPSLEVERQILTSGATTVAGIDEVGRGALAGPVAVGVTVVGATTGLPPPGLADSKLLSAAQRVELVPSIEAWCIASAVGWSTVDEIDRFGIVAALRAAAERALSTLGGTVEAVILDGNSNWLRRAVRIDADRPPFDGEVLVRKRADQTCASVSAASVLAKVARDELMCRLHDDHPRFGWASNKGYGAPAHLAALRTYGPCLHHRRSFRLG